VDVRSLDGLRPAPSAPKTASDGPVQTTEPIAQVAFGALAEMNGKPADPQVAASPTWVVEEVNSELAIFDRSGSGTPAKTVVLSTFFGSTGYGTTGDPQLLYDTPTGRWYSTVVACTKCGAAAGPSAVYLAVSQTSDPNGAWWTWLVASDPNALLDQPRLGFTADKLLVDYSRFTGSTSFDADYLYVLEKADAIAGTQPRVVSQNMTSGLNHRFAIRPAVPNASSNPKIAYAAYRGTDAVGTYASILAVTGTPAGGNVSISEQGPGIAGFNTPPPAAQPGPLDNIGTGDNRFQSVSYVKQGLWIAAEDRCGNGPYYACVRLIHVALGGTATVDADWKPGLADGSYDPAVTTNCTGTRVILTYVASDDFEYPRSQAVTFDTPFPSAYQGFIEYAAGTSPYDQYPNATVQRFGSYSSITSDGTACSESYWMTTMTGGFGTDGTWGTTIAQVTLSPPTITAVSPAKGNAGDTVVVVGNYFSSDSFVTFGAVPATSVTFLDSAHLRVVVPPHAPGTYDVHVTTPLGMSAVAPSDLFTYPGVAYVSSDGSDTVSLVDTSTNAAFGAPIPVAADPAGIRVTSDGSTVWVANRSFPGVTSIDAATRLAAPAIPLGKSPRDVAVTPDGRFLYIPDHASGVVRVYDASKHKVVTNIPTGAGPTRAAMSPDGTFVLVTNFLADTVTRIDTTTNTQTGTVSVSDPFAVAITPDGQRAYVTDDHPAPAVGSVTVLDLSTFSPVGTIDAGRGPVAIAVTPDGTELVVANSGDGTLTPISRQTNTPGPPIPLGAGSDPDGVAITPDGAEAIVALHANDAVVPVTLATRFVGPLAPVGAGPVGVDIGWPVRNPCGSAPIKPVLGFVPSTTTYDAPVALELNALYCPSVGGAGSISVVVHSKVSISAPGGCHWFTSFLQDYDMTLHPGENPAVILDHAPPADCQSPAFAKVTVVWGTQKYTASAQLELS
jgi:YVTN family beta-propeller protein